MFQEVDKRQGRDSYEQEIFCINCLYGFETVLYHLHGLVVVTLLSVQASSCPWHNRSAAMRSTSHWRSLLRLQWLSTIRLCALLMSLHYKISIFCAKFFRIWRLSKFLLRGDDAAGNKMPLKTLSVKAVLTLKKIKQEHRVPLVQVLFALLCEISFINESIDSQVFIILEYCLYRTTDDGIRI